MAQPVRRTRRGFVLSAKNRARSVCAHCGKNVTDTWSETEFTKTHVPCPATGTLPKTPGGSVVSMVNTGSVLEFNYYRSHAAVADGVEFIVEWSDTLANDWSANGVTPSAVPDTNNGASTLWKATLPVVSERCFARMKVTSPSP